MSNTLAKGSTHQFGVPTPALPLPTHSQVMQQQVVERYRIENEVWKPPPESVGIAATTEPIEKRRLPVHVIDVSTRVDGELVVQVCVDPQAGYLVLDVLLQSDG